MCQNELASLQAEGSAASWLDWVPAPQKSFPSEPISMTPLHSFSTYQKSVWKQQPGDAGAALLFTTTGVVFKCCSHLSPGLVVVQRIWGMKTKTWSKQCCGGTLSQTIDLCPCQLPASLT